MGGACAVGARPAAAARPELDRIPLERAGQARRAASRGLAAAAAAAAAAAQHHARGGSARTLGRAVMAKPALAVRPVHIHVHEGMDAFLMPRVVHVEWMCAPCDGVAVVLHGWMLRCVSPTERTRPV